jgi:hypothetical protein
MKNCLFGKLPKNGKHLRGASVEFAARSIDIKIHITARVCWNPEACSAFFFYEILTSTSREIYATMPDDFLAFYART